jgi:hypothetical protein
MHRTTFFRWLLLVVVLLPAIALAREPMPMETQPGRLKIVRAISGERISHIPAPARIGPAVAPTAVFDVTYSGFSPEAQQAFQRAVDIWSTLISSPAPIHVSASFQSLQQGVLGAAGPTTVAANFSNAPFANTWYPAALANKLAGSDLNDSQPEIVAQFNSSFSAWYFGTDGNTPQQDYDFVTVVLHELGHGLGLVDSMDVSGGQGSWGYNGRALIYDRFVENGGGQQLIDTGAFANPSAALGAQLTSDNVFFDGANANAAGGSRPRLYAPSPFQQGSSISHLNLDTYPAGDPNSLMTPALSNGVSTHDPGPIALGIFQDIGWSVEAPGDTPISGLTASNDGPTTIGSPTTLTATTSAGTNVAYSWDFGDGQSGTGASVGHTYAAVGEYQATVTASNSAGSASASTTVVVRDAPISGLTASANGPTNLGNPTTFDAAVTGGTNVSYTWNFGDGQSGSGASVAHRYQAEGSYVASVTASNSAGSASFPVTVDVLPASVSDVVTPNQGTLETPDGTFQASFPAGAVTQTTLVTYTAHSVASQFLSDDLALLRDFTLEATTSGGAPVTQFQQPYTITLRYSEAELAAANVDEASLKLLFWDGTGWADLLPCQGCGIDTDNNRVTVVLDKVGEFALVGTQRLTVFLPVVVR